MPEAAIAEVTASSSPSTARPRMRVRVATTQTNPLTSPAITPLIEPERISPRPMSGRQIAAVTRCAALAPVFL